MLFAVAFSLSYAYFGKVWGLQGERRYSPIFVLAAALHRRSVGSCERAVLYVTVEPILVRTA